MPESNGMSPKRAEAQEIAARLASIAASGQWRAYEGEQLSELRRAIGQRFNRKHVQLVSSGTIAVELALRGVGVGAGDEVVLAGYDFPGNFRAIEAIGARPVLVDVQQQGFTINVERVEQALSNETRAILASHLHGDCAEIKQLETLLASRNVALVEDACQAPGACIADRLVGSFGQASVLSFGGSKLLSAGRGGAILTDDPQVAQRITINNDRGNLAYPLSEIQAALLIPQIKFLDQRHEARRKSFESLLDSLPDSVRALFADCLLSDKPTASPAYYKIPLQSPDRATRDSILTQLREIGIAAGEPFRGFWKRTSNRCRVVGELKESQRASETTALLSFDFLEDDEQCEKVVTALTRLRN